jgi:hypothetical protein
MPLLFYMKQRFYLAKCDLSGGKNMPMLDTAAAKVPPHLWFAVSAVFHYLGPAFAVLLFPAVGCSASHGCASPRRR